MKKLPVLISIPHGGTLVPDELKPYVSINKYDLFNDSDAFTREIYNIGENAEIVISANTARAFIDLNREKDDCPPENTDGVVKTLTCFNKPVYKNDFTWDDELTKIIVENYYEPYHKLIGKSVHDSGVQLALDCHSMAAVGPQIAPDAGKTRDALICLGNVNGQSCSDKKVEHLADCFRTAFSLKNEEVKINNPFSGGYITRKYGMKPIPWIQVEMNRSLYLDTPWFDRDTLNVDNERLKDLNQMFLDALRLFFGK